ncbi:MAG TPA: YbaB/EbfC family nucleoid-associated protein [bacterium]|nr:YbaB/EbfC family nucleoid-associated protein [bacterium]
MAKSNMAGQFNLLQKMQKEMEALQERLEAIQIEGTAGGGMVSVRVNGKQKVLSVTIDPEVVDSEDVEMLEDLIVAAVNQAIDKSRETAQEEMQKIAGGMLGGLPGGLKIPGMPF